MLWLYGMASQKFPYIHFLWWVILVLTNYAQLLQYIYYEQCAGYLISGYGVPLAQREYKMIHLLYHFGATWFSPSIETLYDKLTLLTVAQLACNFWDGLMLNENSYHKLWQCDLYMLVTTKALLVATTRTRVIYNVSSGKWSTNLHTSITIYSDSIWLLVTTL